MTLTMWSAGGQGKARRNAWVAVVANSQQTRERNEATEAVWAAERAHRAGTEPLRAQA